MQVEYKVGDLVLAEWSWLRELEIQDVSQTAKALKVDGQWCDAEKFHAAVRGRLGRIEIRRGIFGDKRVVVRT
jgi:hypothetical protein